MLRHFATLVLSTRQTALHIVPVESRAKTPDCSLGTTFCDPVQGHKQTCRLNELAGLRSIFVVFGEVAS